jgi:hypothetical protein
MAEETPANGLLTMVIFREYLANRMAVAVTGGLVVLLLVVATLFNGDLAALRATVAPFQGKCTCIAQDVNTSFADSGAFAAQAALDAWTSQGHEDRVFPGKKFGFYNITTSDALRRYGVLPGTRRAVRTQDWYFSLIILSANISATAESAFGCTFPRNSQFPIMGITGPTTAFFNDGRAHQPDTLGRQYLGKSIYPEVFRLIFPPAFRSNFELAPLTVGFPNNNKGFSCLPGFKQLFVIQGAVQRSTWQKDTVNFTQAYELPLWFPVEKNMSAHKTAVTQISAQQTHRRA